MNFARQPPSLGDHPAPAHSHVSQVSSQRAEATELA